MPIIWKLYKVVNYLLLVVELVLLIMLVIDFFSIDSSIYLNWGTLLVMALFLLMAINSVINSIWLEKYYPDFQPTDAFCFTSSLFYVLAILCYLTVLTVSVYMTIDLINNSSNFRRDIIGTLRYIMVFFTVIAGIYTLIMQPIMRRTILRNSQKRFAGFLDN